MKLSVVTITYNEEENIAGCLSSVAWADELIVVDAGSTDHTVDRAREFTSRIYRRPWEGYAPAKAFGLTRAEGDWVLWLDADERVTPELAREIRSIVAGPPPPFACYEVARRAFFLGKWIRHCGWYPGYVVRLFRKDAVRFSGSRVHERAEHAGEAGRLPGDLLHYTDRNLYHYTAKLNRYTSLAALDLAGRKKPFSLYRLLVHPPFQFVKMYFIRRGFLDGRHGLVLAVLSSAYVFTKYAKLWEKSVADPSGEGRTA
jgi:glycosyltransferase involved in cell wall biosynthesis